MAKGTKEGKEAETTIKRTSSKTTRTTTGIRIRRRNEGRKSARRNRSKPKPNERRKHNTTENKTRTPEQTQRRGERNSSKLVNSKPNLYGHNIMVTQLSPREKQNEREMPEKRKEAINEKLPKKGRR